MEDTTDIEVVGLAAFAPPPSPPYRYSITLKNERLSIWMAEPESKKQWYLGNLEQADYVKPQYTIPGATATDYVKLFCDLVNGDPEARKLTALATGDVQLELRFQVNPRFSSWVAVYEFTLAPGSIERVNDLEERLLYKEDELNRLRAEASVQSTVIQRLNDSLNARKGGDVEQLRAQLNEQENKLRQLHEELQERHVVLLEATGNNDRGNVCWKKVDSADVVVDDDNSVVRVARADVYVVYGLVQVPHEDFRQGVWLLKNGKKYRPSYDVGISVSGVSYTLVAAMIPLREGDTFRVNSVKDAQVFPYMHMWGMSNRVDSNTP